MSDWIQLDAPSGAGGQFGYSVAMRGGLLAVSAPYANSKGVVYLYDAVNPTETLAILHLAQGAANGRFGYSVAIWENMILVGAPGREDTAGAAYLFSEPPEGWAGRLTPTARLLPSDGLVKDAFGVDVAFDHIGRPLIGAWGAQEEGVFERGAGYLFEGPADGWAGTLYHTCKLTAEYALEKDWLGRAVAAGDGWLVLSAGGTDGPYPVQGCAYVFERPADGWGALAWESARLDNTQPHAGHAFGNVAAVDGEWLGLGAKSLVEAMTGAGVVCLYRRPDGDWQDMNEGARLTPSDGAAGDGFGNALAFQNGLLAAGRYLDDGGRGGVYLFMEPETGWADAQQDGKLCAPEGVAGDHFGWCVALDGGALAIGAPFVNGKGAVYLTTVAGLGPRARKWLQHQ